MKKLVNMKQLLVLLLIVLFSSCSVQKRVYLKGYYVDWHHKRTTLTESSVSNSLKEKRSSTVSGKADPANIPSETVMEHRESETGPVIKNEGPGDSCDVMIFRNGSEISVRVIEVGVSEIKYLKCDNLTGPTYITNKAELFLIKYHNGSRDVFKEQPKYPAYERSAYAPPAKRVRKTLHPHALPTFFLSVAGLVFRVIAFFTFFGEPLFLLTVALIIFCAAILIFSFKINKEIRANSETVKGYGFSNTAYILGLINLCTNLIALLFLLAFF